jgi:hypothetical protein
MSSITSHNDIFCHISVDKPEKREEEEFGLIAYRGKWVILPIHLLSSAR